MVRLGDVGKVITGNTPKTSDLQNYTSNDICFVKPSDIADGTVAYLDGSEFYISEYARAKARILPPKSVLVTCIGIIGKVAINNVECAFNQQINAIIPDNSKCLTEYLAYAVQNKQSEMQDIANAPVVPILNKTQFSDIKIKLPSLTDQEEVADKLNIVSWLISLRQEQLAKLDKLVKSRFIEMFVDKDFPKTTIGELVASKVSSVKKVFLPKDTIKYIDISSIDNKRNIMTGFTEYVLEDAPSRAQQHIRKGDIVVSTVRPNLKNVAITGYDYDNLVASSGFCVLRAEKCLPSYLMAVVCSNDFTDAMTKVVTGANYPAIKDSDVKNYVVPNPPIELQEQFAAFVEQTDKSKLVIQESLAELVTLKKALMQKYFG